MNLVRRQLEQPSESECGRDGDQVGDDAECREDDERRAEDLVQRGEVTSRAVLRDELHERARIAEVEHRKIRGDRRRQHPQAVGRRAQVRHVEWQHDEAEDGFDADRHVPRRHVTRNGQRLAFCVVRAQRNGNGVAHCAPFLATMTLTVSRRIVRSNTSDRCLM